MMSDLHDDIAKFEELQGEFERGHFGQWVLIHDCILIGMFDDFESAAEKAVGEFGRGPYLIRQVGAPLISLPASVMYRPA